MTLRVTHIFRSYLKFVPNAKLLGIITGMFVPEALFLDSWNASIVAKGYILCYIFPRKGKTRQKSL